MTYPTSLPDPDTIGAVPPRCAVCRRRDAEGVLYDAYLRTQGYPYCLDCLEQLLEREAVTMTNPRLAATLPPLPDPTWNEDKEARRHRRKIGSIGGGKSNDTQRG